MFEDKYPMFSGGNEFFAVTVPMCMRYLYDNVIRVLVNRRRECIAAAGEDAEMLRCC